MPTVPPTVPTELGAHSAPPSWAECGARPRAVSRSPNCASKLARILSRMGVAEVGGQSMHRSAFEALLRLH